MMLVVVLGIVAYFGYTKGYVSINLPKPLASADPSKIPSPSPTPDPTANWKTYSNQTYSYEFKLPKNLYVIEDEKPVSPDNSYLAAANIELDPESGIWITVLKTDKYTPSCSSDDLKNYEPLVINGIKAMQGRQYGSAYFLDTCLFGNIYSVDIKYVARKEKQDQIDLYHQILSTFKFTQ